MKKILITGAAGFVGSHLVEYLLEHGVKPNNLRLLIAPWDSLENIPKIDLEIHRGDIRDKETAIKAVRGVSVVYHLAAKTIVPDSGDGYYDDTNVSGTKNLLDAVKNKNIKKFVFFSSISVFGLPAWKGDMKNADEDWEKAPSEPYGMSKLKAEQLLKEYSLKYKISYIIIRPTTVYGPRDKAGIFQLIQSIKNNLFLFVGNAENKMDYVYVRDVVRAAVMATTSNLKSEDFILGAGNPSTQKEIVKCVYTLLNKKPPQLYLNKHLALFVSYIYVAITKIFKFPPILSPKRVKVLTSDCFFDTRKVEKILNFKNEYSIESGISETINWLNKNGDFKKSVIYVNYSPYENSGHILDYLNENFDRVFLFSIAHHPLGIKQKLNKVTYFEGGKIHREIDLYYMQVPASLVWLFLPLRSTINGFQMLKECFLIYHKYGKIDYFFSVNAFAVFVGMVLKKINLVQKTVFWVWDYYPINYPSIAVKISRWMYWQFDKLATYADRVIYLNNRLAKVRKDSGLIAKNENYLVAPIGMGELLPIKPKRENTIKIGFIGVLKKSQGLDMLIKASDFLYSKFKNIEFEIIGSGPDEDYFLKETTKSKVKFNFYGWVPEKTFRKILSNCTLGIAPYSPEESNVSRYGDPGKVKRYLEFNLPSIITDVFEFSKELEKNGAGIVIDYGDNMALADAISKILKNYENYQTNIQRLHKKYYYKNAYRVMFS